MLFDEIKGRISEQYNSSLQNSLEYEKAFGRYLVVGSGAAIIFILSSYLSGERNDLILSGKFDVPLWLFTLSVLLGALNVYISMTLGGRYASSFLLLQSMISEYEMKFTKDELSQDEIDSILLEFGGKWKAISKFPIPFQRALSYLRILTALSFSTGLILSIFYVTSYYGK
jgi:hypothetical protein